MLIDFFNVLNDAASLMLVRRRFPVRVRQTSTRRPGHVVPPSASIGVRCRRDLVGLMALALSDSCDPIGLPSALARLLADHQRLRLSGHELHGLTVAVGISVYNIAFPALLGEMAFMLWLVIMGCEDATISQ
jgi:hypothetical protein